MSETNNAPSPVIRYFLPGLVLGAVLGGTLATVVPEFAASPKTGAELREPSGSDASRDESRGDRERVIGEAAEEGAEMMNELSEDRPDNVPDAGAEGGDETGAGGDEGSSPTGPEGSEGG